MKLYGDKLYFFRYKDPATKKSLKVWDTAPLIIPLDFTSKSLLAINLHWIPSEYRQKFVEFLMEYFKKRKIAGKRFQRTRLFYEFVKSGKVTWALVAVRRYHISRITNMTAIEQKDWPKVLKMRDYRPKFDYTDKFKSATRWFRKPVK